VEGAQTMADIEGGELKMAFFEPTNDDSAVAVSDLKRAKHHEAAHAIVNRHYGNSISYLWATEDGRGRCHWETREELDESSPRLDQIQRHREIIVALLAGKMIEQKLFCSLSDEEEVKGRYGEDEMIIKCDISKLVEEFGFDSSVLRTDLEAECESILTQYNSAISCVANLVMEQHTSSPMEWNANIDRCMKGC